MTDQELEALRGQSFAVAYRMLGSVAEAEDVVQDALLRYVHHDAPLQEPAAWITTVTTRLAIDVLRSARVRRERYVGPWLPEPLVEETAAGPGRHAELADSLSQAFLVVLERLSPVERAAFLLREVFGYDYADVARILEREEPACRQLVARAKRRLEADRPRFDADERVRDALLERFLAAAEEGDLAALERMLAADAVLYSDGGGKATAARLPIFGPARIARFMAGTTRKRNESGPSDQRLARVNGQPGRVLRDAGARVFDVLAVDVVDGRILTVWIIRNPDKLAHL